MKIARTKNTVRNIIFTNLYTDYISNKVKVGTDLEDIKEFYV